MRSIKARAAPWVQPKAMQITPGMPDTRKCLLQSAGSAGPEVCRLACSVTSSHGDAPVLQVVECRGPEWRTLRLETVEDDATMPEAHLVHQPASGNALAVGRSRAYPTQALMLRWLLHLVRPSVQRSQPAEQFHSLGLPVANGCLRSQKQTRQQLIRWHVIVGVVSPPALLADHPAICFVHCTWVLERDQQAENVCRSACQVGATLAAA